MRPLVVLAMLAACSASSESRIRVEIDSDTAWALEMYQVRFDDRAVLAEPENELTLIVPDELTGADRVLSVWGLVGGDQVAFGTTTVTPAKGRTVDAWVGLSMVDCGTFCTLGSIACGGDGLITCEQQSDGCLAWSATTPCPASAPYCSNGECSAQCVDECESGETRCDSSAAVRTCGEFDSDSCGDWSVPDACGSGTTCASGVCGEPTGCSQGDDCDDGDPCTIDDTCSGGLCGGTPRCVAPEHGYATCSASGVCGFTCDPGYQQSGTSCVVDPPTKLIFVTSEGWTGDLGGLSGADAKCQQEATAAGKSGAFKAWLSDSTTSAASRLTHSTKPYVLSNGVTVAANWTQLVSGLLDVPIDRTAADTTVGAWSVWTSTSPSGQSLVKSCQDWTSELLEDSGNDGSSGETGPEWTMNTTASGYIGASPCAFGLRLYCLEQ